MSFDEDTARLYEVVRRRPLVVLGLGAGRHKLEQLADLLIARYPGTRFIGIVCADEGDDVEELLRCLAPLRAELIFTASSSPRAMDGAALAWQALDEFGVGQDFVFTVPRLDDAIRYGLAVLDEGQGRGWEGTAILVTGPTTAVAEARTVMTALDDD